MKGVDIAGRIFKMSQYCDDTTLFVADAQSADNAISIVRDFATFSGLQLNMNKCNFMWLGSKRLCENPICGRVPADMIKILGVNFNAREDCTQANLQAV